MMAAKTQGDSFLTKKEADLKGSPWQLFCRHHLCGHSIHELIIGIGEKLDTLAKKLLAALIKINTQ